MPEGLPEIEAKLRAIRSRRLEMSIRSVKISIGVMIVLMVLSGLLTGSLRVPFPQLVEYFGACILAGIAVRMATHLGWVIPAALVTRFRRRRFPAYQPGSVPSEGASPSDRIRPDLPAGGPSADEAIQGKEPQP